MLRLLLTMLSLLIINGRKSFPAGFRTASYTKLVAPSRQSRVFSEGGAITTHFKLPSYGHPKFGITRELPGKSFENAVEETKAALKKSGFGVITEIDMKATVKNKLDQDIEPYVILGACQPTLAFQALQHMPSVGLLLPCNIVVSVNEGGAYVSAVDPVALFSLVESKDMKPVAEQVQALIKTAIYSI